MARVIVTPQARSDVERAIAALDLPGDTWARIERSLQVVETFPRAGRQLQGRWAEARFVLGPWPWMILLYRYEESTDRVYLVAVDDARSADSAADADSGPSGEAKAPRPQERNRFSTRTPP